MLVCVLRFFLNVGVMDYGFSFFMYSNKFKIMQFRARAEKLFQSFVYIEKLKTIVINEKF